MKTESNLKTVKKVTLLGAIANAGLASAKITIGKLTGSNALLADGLHSISDLISDAVIYFGSSHWSRPADADHPYGHGRFETLINAFLALSLLTVSMGLVFGIVGASESPNTTDLGSCALLVAILGIIVKEWLYRWTLSKAKAVDSMALKANAHHHRSDALSSLPVVIAVISQHFFPELTIVDDVATMIVSLMIAKASYDIAEPIFFELTEKRTAKDVERKIQYLALESSDIKEVHHIRSRKLGGDVIIDLHILVDKNITVYEGHRIAEYFKEEITSRITHTKDVLIHVEPFVCKERVIYSCNDCPK